MLLKIEPKHDMLEYIGMDAVTTADGRHYAVLHWWDGCGGSAQDEHGPYSTRVEAIAALREFGRLVNTHRKLMGLEEKQWRYR